MSNDTGSHLESNYRNLDTGVETTVLRRTEKFKATEPGPQLFVQPAIITQPARPVAAAGSQRTSA